MDHTLFYIQVKKATKTVTLNYQTIVIYVSTTNVPLKSDIFSTYTNWHICRYEPTMSVYISHMSSLQSTM